MDTGVTLASPDSITTPSLVPDEGQGDPFCHLTAEPREPGLGGADQEVDPTDGWDTSQGAKTGGLRGEETWWTVRATPGGDVRNLQDVRSSPPCLEPGGGSVTSLYCCSDHALHDMSSTHVWEETRSTSASCGWTDFTLNQHLEQSRATVTTSLDQPGKGTKYDDVYLCSCL